MYIEDLIVKVGCTNSLSGKDTNLTQFTRVMEVVAGLLDYQRPPDYHSSIFGLV